MKTLRQLIAGTILILSLALVTYGDDGHIPCPAVTSPQPTDTAGMMEYATVILQSLLPLS